MDVKLVNPFIEATIHVLSSLAFTQAHAGVPYIKVDHVAKGDISGVVGLTGEAKGTISVTFTQKCILHIVSSMFGDEIKEMNEEVKDAVGEILNIVSGHGRQKIQTMGKTIQGAIPTVVVGKDHVINHMTSYPIVAIPFETENGGFTFEVCLEE